MSTKWKPVTEKYFGQPIGNGQDPDETWDTSAGTGPTAEKIGGRGSQGGGSKPARNPGRSGSVGLGSSAPKSAQKIRGR